MQSGEGLRGRIDELSSEIDCYRKVLKDLETPKSAVQSDPNSILDPIHSVSSPPTPRIHFTHALTISLSVCRSWSNNALSTPSLWTAISDKLDVAVRHFKKFFDLWLTRARGSPLSLSLDRFLDEQHAPDAVVVTVRTLVRQNVGQMQNLKLHLTWGKGPDGPAAARNLIGYPHAMPSHLS